MCSVGGRPIRACGRTGRGSKELRSGPWPWSATRNPGLSPPGRRPNVLDHLRPIKAPVPVTSLRASTRSKTNLPRSFYATRLQRRRALSHNLQVFGGSWGRGPSSLGPGPQNCRQYKEETVCQAGGEVSIPRLIFPKQQELSLPIHRIWRAHVLLCCGPLLDATDTSIFPKLFVISTRSWTGWPWNG